ncbi:unnamed protein product [Euphydryas editha]|nr:unnamed protein product [Euphydryas editha]
MNNVSNSNNMNNVSNSNNMNNVSNSNNLNLDSVGNLNFDSSNVDISHDNHSDSFDGLFISPLQSPVELTSDEELVPPSNEMFVRGEGAVTRPQVPVTGTERPVRSTRLRKPVRYEDYDLSDSSMFVHNSEYVEPSTYEEAVSGPNRSEWLSAMQEEYRSLLDNNVWQLVDRPNNVNIIKCKWVYKLKTDSVGSLIRYKARLVARGFTQRKGIDYSETFSPVVRHSTMRVLFCIANELDMDIEHVDVTTAFLHGNLEEQIFMEQPVGFETDKDKVCLLNKSIYGLRQSSRIWNCKVNSVLTSNGYSQSQCEPCVYLKKTESDLTIIALYVDDFYIFSSCKSEKTKLINLLKSEFECKHLGSIQNCLGISVRRDRKRGLLILNQSEYIKKLLTRFGMQSCKSVSTPMEVNCKFNTKCDTLSENNCPYRELIGGLMYLSVCTRPDISYALSQLSQFNTAFTKDHWLAAKRILRYLSGTTDYGLVYVKTGNLDISVYADADWANDLTDRKSYSGFVVKLGGSTVNWESRKQRCVALSSTEAEYLAIGDACKELCFVRNFMNEIFGKQFVCKVYSDNQSALRLLEVKEYCHRKTKHIDIRYHFVKDLIKNNNVITEYMSTEHMIADVLTKPLGRIKHLSFVKELCLQKLGL